MRRKRKNQFAAEMDINLTPMIDCTFQLIIFFILTAQMASSDLAKLLVHRPYKSTALTAETGMDINKPNQVTVNVVNEYGDKKDNRDPGRSSQPLCYKIGTQTIEIGDVDRLLEIFNHRKASAKAAGYKEGDFFLEIRADRDVEYGGVEPVMEAAIEAGISKVNMTAIVDSSRNNMKVDR